MSIKNLVILYLVCTITVSMTGCSDDSKTEESISRWPWVRSTLVVSDIQDTVQVIREQVATLRRAKPEYPRYTFERHEIFIDLTERQAVPGHNKKAKWKDTDPVSRTYRLHRITFGEPLADAGIIRLRHATDGLAILPYPLSESEGRALGCDIYKSKLGFDTGGTTVGPNLVDTRIPNLREIRNTFFVEIPITATGAKVICYGLMYFNGYQGVEQWAGTLLASDTSSLIFKIRFADQDTPKSFTGYRRESDQDKSIEYAHQPTKHKQGRLLSWVIQDGKKDEAYFINWRW